MLVVCPMNIKASSSILQSPTTSTTSQMPERQTSVIDGMLFLELSLRLTTASRQFLNNHAPLAGCSIPLSCQFFLCNSITIGKVLLNWHPTTLPHVRGYLWNAGVGTAQEQTTISCLEILAFQSSFCSEYFNFDFSLKI